MRVLLSMLVLAVVSPAVPPPRIRPAPGWVAFRPGDQPCRCMVVAVTAGDAPAMRPFAPFEGFKRLRPSGIIVWATTIRRGGTTQDFRRIKWPPLLSTFRVDQGWENQPAANIQQRLIWGTVRGWQLDVRVYFATQHPDRKLLAKAQAELNHLRLPRG